MNAIPNLGNLETTYNQLKQMIDKKFKGKNQPISITDYHTDIGFKYEAFLKMNLLPSTLINQAIEQLNELLFGKHIILFTQFNIDDINFNIDHDQLQKLLKVLTPENNDTLSTYEYIVFISIILNVEINETSNINGGNGINTTKKLPHVT